MKRYVVQSDMSKSDNKSSINFVVTKLLHLNTEGDLRVANKSPAHMKVPYHTYALEEQKIARTVIKRVSEYHKEEEAK